MSNFPKNEHFLPTDTHTYVCVSGGKKCTFFGKFALLCFLETPVLKFTFLPYDRRINRFKSNTEAYGEPCQTSNMKCCRVNTAFLTLIRTSFLVKDLIKICKWSKIHYVWKVFVFWVLLVCIFAHLESIQTRKTPKTDSFHVVTLWVDQCIKNKSSQAVSWRRAKWATATADELFECAWSFCGIGAEGVNYFVRKLRCFTGFWIHLWINGSGYSRTD